MARRLFWIHDPGCFMKHKENLAKQAATSTTTAVQQEHANPVTQPLSISSSTYVDRAEQRRQLHDVEKMNANSLRMLNSDLHSIVTADTNPSQSSNLVDTKATGSRSSTLDESNIGHQMLQKLGWKSGNVLGKKTDSSSANTGTADDDIRPSESSTTTIVSRMEQDWDRIEAVAKLASSQQNTNMNAGIKGIGH
jgi:G-patch domain